MMFVYSSPKSPKIFKKYPIGKGLSPQNISSSAPGPVIPVIEGPSTSYGLQDF